MSSFPVLSSGKVVAKYPLTRRVKMRTMVYVASDLSEQRFSKGSALTEFELVFTRVKTADKELVRIFWNGRRGSFDTTWDFTLPDPTPFTFKQLQFDPSMVAFEATTEVFDRWTFTLKVRQTRRQ